MKKQEKNHLNDDFSSRLKQAIINSGLKQKELAKRIGVSEITISRYCKGTQSPIRGNIFLLASALNVTPSWLEYGDKEQNLSDIEPSPADNLLPEEHINWKRRALAAEERLQRIETILREIFAFARIGQ